MGQDSGFCSKGQPAGGDLRAFPSPLGGVQAGPAGSVQQRYPSGDWCWSSPWLPVLPNDQCCGHNPHVAQELHSPFLSQTNMTTWVLDTSLQVSCGSLRRHHPLDPAHTLCITGSTQQLELKLQSPAVLTPAVGQRHQASFLNPQETQAVRLACYPYPAARLHSLRLTPNVALPGPQGMTLAPTSSPCGTST